jgi:hypothetical protein
MGKTIWRENFEVVRLNLKKRKKERKKLPTQSSP